MGLEVNGENILLVNVDNHIYAYADSCPHQMSRLNEGTLTDKILRCARHHWEFDVSAGCGINPQNACLKAYPVAIESRDIFLDLDDGRSTDAVADGENEG